MLTCKQFLQELNDYLDPNTDAEMKRKLESHVTDVPIVFVIVDTTQKTLQIYKGSSRRAFPKTSRPAY